MKSTAVLSMALALIASALAQSGLPENTDNILLNRLQLMGELQKNVAHELQEDQKPARDSKSVSRAVIYSAVLPGAGQFYAKSYIKAALFVAVEAAAWTINITNNNKGDKKTTEFETFADQKWSEYRYWSYVNYLGDVRNLEGFDPYPYEKVEGKEWYLIDKNLFEQNEQSIKNNLRQIEKNFPGFSHDLPETKTQQYYEMIGKYPEQFGNAWEDANFNASYNGYEGRITPLNNLYTNTRDQANNFYERAGYGSMIVLVNHLLSAIDAGFTTRKYNERQLRFTYHQTRYEEENVNMFGLSMNW